MKQILSYRHLIKNLVVKDLKLKYRDSVFGFLWSLLNPVFMIVTYVIAFKYIMKASAPNYVLFLLAGVLHWNLFAQCLSASTGAVVDNAGLVKKVYFPLEALPLGAIFFSLVQYLFALVVFFPVALIFLHLRLSWVLLLVFPILFLQILFSIGLGFLVSTITVFYRDVKHFVEIFLMLGFWLTPVVYQFTDVPVRARAWIADNPMTDFISSYQSVLLHNQTPAPLFWRNMLIAVFLSLLIGAWTFSRFKTRFAEEI